MNRSILMLSGLSVVGLLTIVYLSINVAYNYGRTGGLRDGFVTGQIDLLQLMSNETGDFPVGSGIKDYRKIYGAKTFNVFVHKNDDSRTIVVTGQF